MVVDNYPKKNDEARLCIAENLSSLIALHLTLKFCYSLLAHVRANSFTISWPHLPICIFQ